MKVQKKAGSDYLLVKLNSRDKKYLEGFIESESIKTLKNTDNYFSQMMTVHIKAVYVMQTALALEQEGVISPVVISRVFRELDRTIHGFEDAVNKYFLKFGDLTEASKKKKYRKTKKRRHSPKV